MIRPGFASFHPGLIFSFVAAILFAVRQIISRHVSHHDRTATTVAYTSLTATFLLTYFDAICLDTNRTCAPVPCPRRHVAAVGAWRSGDPCARGRAGGLCMSLHYTIIIWASFYGFLLFGQFPDLWTWIGAAIITASGLYVMHRERVRDSDS